MARNLHSSKAVTLVFSVKMYETPGVVVGVWRGGRSGGGGGGRRRRAAGDCLINKAATEQASTQHTYSTAEPADRTVLYTASEWRVARMQGREGGRVVSRTPAQSMKHTAVQQNRLWPVLYHSLIQIHIRICFVFSSGLLRFRIIIFFFY